jgi:hypothetical protein
MLCISLNNYAPICNATVGGVNRSWAFDPSDFNFTAGANLANGQPSGYNLVVLRAGIGAVATAVLTGTAVTAINVTTGGTLYPIAPTVVLTGGAGTGATAVANIVGGVVTGITVTAGGTGYTSAPAVSFTNTGATVQGGAKMYPINFLENTGEYTFDNPESESCSIAFKHTFSCTVINISQELNNFINGIDAAGCCCGLGIVMELNSGVILVMGEKFVGNVEGKRFKIKASSKGSSGKKFEDNNSAELTFNGSFTRPLNTFTGGVGAILAFQ